jgi:hypothetical protein
MERIFSVPGKMEVYWEERAKAIVDVWESYFISLEEFREATLAQGLKHAMGHGGHAYIVDSSRAKGAFSQEIQDFIDSDVFPAYAKGGIKYFITITAQSAVTRLTVSEYSSKLGPHGIRLVEVHSVEAAVDWLRDNAP